MNRKELIKEIIEKYEVDWTNHKFLIDFLKLSRAKTYLEIGVFGGLNLHRILEEMPDLIVDAIDPYTSFDEMYFSEDAEEEKNRWEEMYQFVSKSFESDKNMTLHRTTSDEYFSNHKNKTWDVIFVDGAHSYQQVKKDLENSIPRFNKVLIGHDYNMRGVKKAVKEIFNKDYYVESNGNFWFVFKRE